MALSDYMPYGAPELLDSAQSCMARSTMVASLTVAVLVASMGAWLSRAVPPSPVIVEEKNVFDLFEWMEPLPPPLAPPDVPHVPPAPPAGPVSEYQPKDDVIVPPNEAPPVGPLVDPRADIGPGQPYGRTGEVTGEGKFVDPTPDQFVWTDEMPMLVQGPKPNYPDLARDAGVEGLVTVLLLIGLDGRVEKAVIAPKGSVPMLDQAALEAARRSVFTPALANGRPVKVWVRQQYRFALH